MGGIGAFDVLVGDESHPAHSVRNPRRFVRLIRRGRLRGLRAEARRLRGVWRAFRGDRARFARSGARERLGDGAHSRLRERGGEGLVQGSNERYRRKKKDSRVDERRIDEGGLSAEEIIKLKALQDRIVYVLVGYGISPQNFTMSASPSSGFALKISNIGKLEARQNQMPLYRKNEQKIFHIERTIWNYHNLSKPIDMASSLIADFIEPNYPKSPDEQIKEDEFNLMHNITTEIDLLMLEYAKREEKNQSL